MFYSRVRYLDKLVNMGGHVARQTQKHGEAHVMECVVDLLVVADS